MLSLHVQDGQRCIAVTVCSSHRLHVTAACVAVALCWQQKRKSEENEEEKKINSISTSCDACTTVIGAWIGVHALLQHL